MQEPSDEAKDLAAHLVAHAEWPSDEVLLRVPPERLRLYFMAMALAGEAGEMANQFKKDWRGDGGEEALLAKARGELVDIANYVFMLARLMDVDLPPAMLAKLKEVEARPGWRGPKVP